jgi:chlorobactene glucosyltransferase
MKVVEILAWAIAIWWFWGIGNAVLNALFIPRLPRGEPGGELPSLTVVIPARNEEEDVADTVERFCTQDYPGIEVVVVDDGSTDATPQILKGLSERFGNLVVVQGTEPPEGWLGKPHAQHQGLARASGELILFADADVKYEPGVVKRAVGELLQGDLDMLLLLSRLEGRGLERVVMTNLDAFTLYVAPLFLANVPWFKSLGFGAGSGNLVRREALEAAGGIEAIRSEIIDDVAMGRMIKAYRGRFRFVMALDDISIRMYKGLRASIEGFTKNYYALFKHNPVKAVFMQACDLAVHTLPPVLLAPALFVPALAPVAPPLMCATTAGLACNLALCGWSGRPLWVGLLYPLRAVLWSIILTKSMWRRYTRGLEWRGRRYLV